MKECLNCGQEHFLDAPCEDMKRPNYTLRPEERHSDLLEKMREDMENKRYNCLSYRLQFGMKRVSDTKVPVQVSSAQAMVPYGRIWNQDLDREVDYDSDSD